MLGHLLRTVANDTIGGRAFVAALLAVGAVGCQSAATRPAQHGITAPNSGGHDRTGAPTTDFHSEVGPEQQYNVHVEMAKAQESAGNFEAALAEYQQAADVCEKRGTLMAGSKLGPAQRALVQRRMGSALDRLGRFGQAETHYLKAMKLTPNDAKVWNDVGYSYYAQGRPADAERALKTADAIEPNNPKVLTNLGLTLAALGKNSEALAAFNRAAGPAVGNANFGYILAALGKTDLAREHYAAALAHQPELAPARHALAALEARKARVAAPVSTAALPPLPNPNQAVAAAAPKPVQIRSTSLPYGNEARTARLPLTAGPRDAQIYQSSTTAVGSDTTSKIAKKARQAEGTDPR